MIEVFRLVLFVLAVNTTTAAAQDLGQLVVPTERTDLLAGRLTISVPNQARSEAMRRGIMAAPEADSEQTRIVIDAGKQRMVLMIYELFARTGVDFESAVRKQASDSRSNVNIQKWPLSSQVRAIAYFPVVPTKGREANLVMGLFVVALDGNVQNLEWYVNPAAATQFDAALNLAKAIAKTIAPGNRNLDIGGGERVLSVYSETKKVFITVPKGYVATAQRGPDFVVHHVRKVAAFGDASASLGVYLGDHPSAQHEGFLQQGTGILLGKKIQWYQKMINEDGHRTTMTKALVPLGPSLLGWVLPGRTDSPSYAEIFLEAADTAASEELRNIAMTLRVGDRTMQH